MTFFNASVVSTLSGTILMILVYFYLYHLYRERYIGIWILSWLIHLLRIVVFDSGLYDWTHLPLGFSIYLFLSISNALIFVWGTNIFVGKPTKILWLYAGFVSFLVSTITLLLAMPVVYTLFFPAWFCATIYTWTGITFIRHLSIKGLGKLITGCAYILWGLHTYDMPFLIDVAWFAPWGYLIDGFLRLVIACGTLLVYFEKTRLDLVNKEAQYRLLTENAVDVIYRYTFIPQPKFEYMSPSVFSVTGYTPEEYYENPKLLWDIIHRKDLPLINKFIKNPACANSQPITLRIIRKDQNIVWIEPKGVPFCDDEGNIIALEGIIRDVTARKNLEQDISRLDRMNMVGEMAANVAHEIRNPLTTVRGYLQLIGNKKQMENYKENFELMISELDRTNSIISEYLSLAKNKLVDLKLCNLNNIITALSPLIQADAVAHNIQVQLNLTDISDLYLDENEIRQLLLNLIRNGLEAMPRGGNLYIQTFLDNSQVVLSIRDQGSGIPEQILNNLGTPFMTTKDTGTGLGLPVCYRIASRHNADIQVETGNTGTTFFIRFNPPNA